MNSFEFVDAVQKGEIDVVESTRGFIKKAKEIDTGYNYFYTFCEEKALEDAERVAKNPKGKLAGLPVSVKDCICVKNVESRAGSEILRGYHPVADATAIRKIREQGGIVIGKTTQDEFGFGSFSVNTSKIPKHPFDKERSCGGSSGGAAGFTAKISMPHIALAESTGGSIACPASFCGVAGLTPTYSLVSRYGLIDYANSLDKIGVVAKTANEAALMLEVISGYDRKDATSADKKKEQYAKYAKKQLKIGIIKHAFSASIDNSVRSIVKNKIRILEKRGYDINAVELPISEKYALEAYYLIAMAESSTNLAKYCGIRYGAADELAGNFNEYFTKVRSRYFSREAKRRIILGTFARMHGFRDAFYLKAMKARTAIINEYKNAFLKFDVLCSPAMPITAPRFPDIEKLTPLQNYMIDTMTVAPNTAGMPHISINAGFSGKMPVGIMFTADHFQEGKLISIGKEIENERD